LFFFNVHILSHLSGISPPKDSSLDPPTAEVCIFAYGQTGSGKTFTMTGSDAYPGAAFWRGGGIFGWFSWGNQRKTIGNFEETGDLT
jgi:hypothetical protein